MLLKSSLQVTGNSSIKSGFVFVSEYVNETGFHKHRHIERNAVESKYLFLRMYHDPSTALRMTFPPLRSG